jgi:hypothetical protein
MSDKLGTTLLAVALALISTATIAALFSSKANTANVIKAGGNAFSTAILAAVSPITGTTPNISSF